MARIHYSWQITGDQFDNLVAVARYLVSNSALIDAHGGLRFGDLSMRRVRPLPATVADLTRIRLPPLAYGRHAGVSPRPSDDWRAYCQRAFGIPFDQPIIYWLQGKDWQTTEPSAVGAALRIAYYLEYGIPNDYAEIAAGKAGTNYDANGFLWDRLDMLPPGYVGGPLKPLREWPA